MCGFCISFPENDYILWEMTPKDAFKHLINEVKAIMNELRIEKPSYCFVLQLNKWRPRLFSNNVSSNGVFLLRFPVKRLRDELKVRCRPDKQEFYHELMHIKDVVCGRFPTIGCDGIIIQLINFLWMFSIEGRLKKMGKPHLKREEAIRLHEACVLQGKVTREQSERFCKKLWGKKVTYEDLKPIANKLLANHLL